MGHADYIRTNILSRQRPGSIGSCIIVSGRLDLKTAFIAGESEARYCG